MSSVITLDAIKAEQNRITEMIAKFEAQAVTTYRVPDRDIELSAGERYAGIILDEEGNPAYHLILLPGDQDSINWKDAKKWASDQGGELPTRREQSLLFANLAGEFEKAWYWSTQQHETDSGYAWYQNFSYGGQDNDGIDIKLRARAVRRLFIY